VARLFAYIVTHDNGFAPNPHFGFCTLACCKPVIRRIAQEGDYVVGLSRKAEGNRLIYAMEVCEKLTFASYWKDERFEKKKADPDSKNALRRAGDNIYEPIQDNALDPSGYKQHPSLHSNPSGDENQNTKHHDLGGEYVLIAPEGHFIYRPPFAVELPEKLRRAFLTLSRGHRSRFTEEEVSAFKTFFEDLLGSFAPDTLPMATPPVSQH